MRQLLVENKDLFEKYSIRDAELTLYHAQNMEGLALTYGNFDVITGVVSCS